MFCRWDRISSDDDEFSSDDDESSDDDNDEEIECSVDEVEFSACDDNALFLTDSLAVHFTEWVLLLTVNRAYERVDDDLSVRSILELFIYVQFFERNDYFYTLRYKDTSDVSDFYSKESIMIMIIIWKLLNCCSDSIE